MTVNFIKSLFVYISFSCLLSCADQEENVSNVSATIIDNGAEIFVVGNDIVDFGNVMQGENIEVDFMIENIGEGDLIISDVRTSCGCTVPIWPKENIKHGEKKNIHVTFNTAGKEGSQNKKVTLITNATPSVKVLTITGNIITNQN